MNTTTNLSASLVSNHTSLGKKIHFAALAAIVTALFSSSVAAANRLTPPPTPGPDRTQDCDFVDETVLNDVSIADGDADGLVTAAAQGGNVIHLEPHGTYLLDVPLYVAPKTVIVGDPKAKPIIAAMGQMSALVQLTYMNRIEGVELTGWNHYGDSGIETVPWMGNHAKPDMPSNIQILDSLVNEFLVHGIYAHDMTCLQVENTIVVGVGLDPASCGPKGAQGDLVRLQQVRYVDFRDVDMHYAPEFGLRGLNVIDFKAANIHATTYRQANSCGVPALPSAGIAITNDWYTEPKYAPSVEIWNSTAFSEDIGFYFEGKDIIADFDSISTYGENAVVSAHDPSTVCIDAAPSSAPSSLLTWGYVKVPCSNGIQPSGPAFASPW